MRNRQSRRSHEDHEDSGEDEQHEGEDHLHRCLGGLLFRYLFAPGAHRIGLNAQRLGDA